MGHTVNVLSFISTLKSFGGIFLAVVILLMMVTVHEFGHYLAGKILKFKINEFSVGFGPALFKKRSKKTGELFALRLIPLGGYCAFDGEDGLEETEETAQPFAEYEQEEKTQKDGGIVATNDETYPEPKGKPFTEQAPWKRIIVLLAGAFMNYILALFFIVGMFAGIGRPLYSVMLTNPEETAQTATMADDGLRDGDVLLEINGHNLYLITDYMSALDGKDAGETVVVTVLREGKKTKANLTLAIDADFKNMSDTRTLLHALNVYGLYTTTVKQGFFETMGHSFAYSFKIGGTVLRSLGELLTGKLGLDAMGGPVTTINVTAKAASSSVLAFLNIAALIGVNLAVFNLLPIPALDGCKVIFCIIEWIRKKPVNRKVEAMIHFIGIIFLLGFAVLVDLLQLF